MTTPLLVVCDGWVEPRHPRKVLQDGDPARVSHGICPECLEAVAPKNEALIVAATDLWLRRTA